MPPPKPRIAPELLTRIHAEVWQLALCLFEHPELGGEETKSARLLGDYLEGKGFRLTRGLGGLSTAFRADKNFGGNERPRAAFLAEYDALPGIGHACGHPLIAAASIGAAIVSAETLEKNKHAEGAVALVGTPAEETFGGKITLLRAGVFEDVDAAMMMHPSHETRVNTTSLACQEFQVTFHGKSAHAAASPDQGINALDALVEFYISLNLLRKQLRRDILIPGIIVEGGERPNIVPAKAVGAFSIRAKDGEGLREAKESVRRLAESSAKAFGASLTLHFNENAYDAMRTNAPLAEVFARVLREEGMPLVTAPRKSMGSLDMGNISRRLPSIHPMLAVCDASEGKAHTPAFASASASARAKKMLLIAIRALAETGLSYLSDKALRQRVKKNFEAESKGELLKSKE